MNSVCADCQNKGTCIHEFSIQHCSIIYPTGLRDERKPPCAKGCHVPLTAFYWPVKALFSHTVAICYWILDLPGKLYKHCYHCFLFWTGLFSLFPSWRGGKREGQAREECEGSKLAGSRFSLLLRPARRAKLFLTSEGIKISFFSCV